MEKLSVAPEIEVLVLLRPISGDLRVRGWDRDEVAVESERATLQQDAGTGQVTVTCQGDCRLHVPARAHLTVQSVAGDARITGVVGDLAIDNVSGDLTLSEVGPTRIENVASDLRAKRVNGPLEVQNVGSDATVRTVQGDVHIRHVGADLLARGVEGSCVVEALGSDLVLSIPFYPEKTYRFHAGADVVCRVLPGTSARFILPLGADVRIDAEGASQSQDAENQTVTFGEGEAEVHIQAGGQLRLVSQAEEDWEPINIELELNLEERLASVEERLAEQLAGLEARLRAKSERLQTKTEAQGERLRRKAERHAERLQRAAERRAKKGKAKGRGWAVSWGPPTPPSPPPPPVEPVSDEERMTILRMVESKQITVEEAEKLLAALEGRSR